MSKQLEFIEKFKEKTGVLIDNIIEGDTNRQLSFFMVFAFVAFIFLVFIDLFALLFNWQRLGTFGDFLGGVANPIFSFITFLCLVMTIVMQRKELKLSRDELELTRREYSETKNVIRKQSIESTFYSGINLHHEIVKNLQLDLGNFSIQNSWLSERDRINLNETSTGRECFSTLINILSYHDPDEDELIRRYKIINNEKNEWFGHYFRNLYRIMKIIDDLPEPFSLSEKKEYCHTLRAQLSANELAVLMLNSYKGVCDRGEFQGLLSRYEMLEHLPLSGPNSDNTVKVVGVFDVSFFFLGKYLVSDQEIVQNSKKLDLRRHPGGAFGKNSYIHFPKRFYRLKKN